MSADDAPAEFELFDARVAVLNLPEGGLDELTDALTQLAGDFVANEGWVELGGPSSAAALWRGWTAGGIAGAYLALAPVAREHDLDLLVSDTRVDIAVSGQAADVVVTGVLRMPVAIPVDDFDALVVDAMTPDQLFTRLRDRAFAMHESSESYPHPSSSAPSPFQRPEAVTIPVPGRIDWDYLQEATLLVYDEFDEEGLLDDAGATFECAGMTTQLLPPGMADDVVVAGTTELRWRAAQRDARDDDGDVCVEVLTLRRVLELLPSERHEWARRLTADAIEQTDAWLAENPDEDDLRRDRDILARELTE